MPHRAMASTGNPMNAGGALSGEAEEGGARDSMGGKWRVRTLELAGPGSNPCSAACCVALDKLNRPSEPRFPAL